MFLFSCLKSVFKLLFCVIFTFQSCDDEHMSYHLEINFHKSWAAGETWSVKCDTGAVIHVSISACATLFWEDCCNTWCAAAFSGCSHLRRLSAWTDAVHLNCSPLIWMLAVFLMEKRTRKAQFNNQDRWICPGAAGRILEVASFCRYNFPWSTTVLHK